MTYNRTRFRKLLQEELGVDELDDKVDLLIYLDYVLFLEKLTLETEQEKKKVTNPKKPIIIRAKDMEQKAEKILRQFRG